MTRLLIRAWHQVFEDHPFFFASLEDMRFEAVRCVVTPSSSEWVHVRHPDGTDEFGKLDLDPIVRTHLATLPPHAIEAWITQSPRPLARIFAHPVESFRILRSLPPNALPTTVQSSHVLKLMADRVYEWQWRQYVL